MAAPTRVRFDPEKLRQRMQAELAPRGFSVKELADASGLSIWSWYGKLDGTQTIKLEDCRAIADLLGAPSLWPFVDWDLGLAIDNLLKPS